MDWDNLATTSPDAARVTATSSATRSASPSTATGRKL